MYTDSVDLDDVMFSPIIHARIQEFSPGGGGGGGGGPGQSDNV